ncbi:hypothetical protein HF324_26505 [Chitinophaga oryzae]|uniref:Uncharacterized protein n=1 Tax=Chitinophaga oryzae TaxID=2725414 RepID=A0ABX6LR02_9BACT|nr:hypothetical protein [Chitinophaga oryzae]QJB41199.1 hypothetical protein HF324_26505 [Chitinophaga oryzae]
MDAEACQKGCGDVAGKRMKREGERKSDEWKVPHPLWPGKIIIPGNKRQLRPGPWVYMKSDLKVAGQSSAKGGDTLKRRILTKKIKRVFYYKSFLIRDKEIKKGW